MSDPTIEKREGLSRTPEGSFFPDLFRKAASYTGSIREDLRSPQTKRRAALIAAMGGMALMTILPDSPATHVQALDHPNPVVRSLGIDHPERPNAEISVESFIYNGGNWEWKRMQGLYSPTTGRPITGVEVSLDGVYKLIFYPTDDVDIYPELAISLNRELLIRGITVNSKIGIGAIATAVSDNNPGILHGKGGEITTDPAHPEDSSKRIILPNEGMDFEIRRGGLTFYGWIENAQGIYLAQGIAGAVDPANDGLKGLQFVQNELGLYMPTPEWKKMELNKASLPIVSK